MTRAAANILNLRLCQRGALVLVMALSLSIFAVTAPRADMPDAPTVGTNYYPDTASSLDIATIYYRLIRQRPDFRSWVPYLPEYKGMSEAERISYLDSKSQDLNYKFNLLTLQEPIAVQFDAVLSPYSDDNEGYIVRNFADETFFSFAFAKNNYAVIPQGLMEHQFLAVQKSAKAAVESGMNGSNRHILMIIYVQPNYADPSAQPTDIAGKSYRLVSGKVVNIALYSMSTNKKTATVLWEMNTKEYNDKQRDELLNLKQ
ncbi:MAG: hypothetical protein PW788_02405 [Micavibrio sp.]|nr:hypothetical protein [Micavibrio sp.]